MEEVEKNQATLDFISQKYGFTEPEGIIMKRFLQEEHCEQTKQCILDFIYQSLMYDIEEIVNARFKSQLT